MRKASKFLTSGFIAASLAVSIGSLDSASAWDCCANGRFASRSSRVHLGPWVHGEWDYIPGYVGGFGYYPGGVFFGAEPTSWAYFPYGPAAPYVRRGRLCIANQWTTNGFGVYVRYQKVQPSIYCDP